MTLAQLKIIARDVEKLRDMMPKMPPHVEEDAFLASLAPSEFVEFGIILARMDHGIKPKDADIAFLNSLVERFDAGI